MSQLSQKYRGWFWFSMVLTILAAFFATGYHHPDEYMQIIEFANSKLGGISPNELPWEYHETMRPWLQPGLFYSLTNLMHALGVESPFLIWSLFRLMHGLLGWVSMLMLAIYCQKYCLANKVSEKSMALIIGACAFLFYLPWIFTRASSESLCASLFLISALIVLNSNEESFKKYLFSGLLAGVSFLARYQAGFFIMGFIFWLYFVRKANSRLLLNYFLGGCVAMIVGVLIDTWGYGHTAFSAYNYFYQNIVLNKAAQWGVKPFWYYLVLAQNHGMPLHTLILTFAFGFSVFKFYKNPFVWIAVPFIFIHSIVGHKEMRFLFPLAVLGPVFLMLWLSRFEVWFKYKKAVVFLLSTNFIALIILCLWPSRTEVLLQSETYSRKVQELVVLGKNPYSLGDNPVYFTRPKELSLKFSSSLESFVSDRTTQPRHPQYLVSTYSEITGQLKDVGCEKRWGVFPSWVSNLIYYKWLEAAGNYSLYSCD